MAGLVLMLAAVAAAEAEVGLRAGYPGYSPAKFTIAPRRAEGRWII